LTKVAIGVILECGGVVMARERLLETGRNGSTVAHVVEELCTLDHGIDILAKITEAHR
jgi:hypothetical protein